MAEQEAGRPLEKCVEVVCHYCGYHLAGAFAGNYVRWETCRGCEYDPDWHLGLIVWFKRKWRDRKYAKRLAGKRKPMKDRNTTDAFRYDPTPTPEDTDEPSE